MLCDSRWFRVLQKQEICVKEINNELYTKHVRFGVLISVQTLRVIGTSFMNNPISSNNQYDLIKFNQKLEIK